MIAVIGLGKAGLPLAAVAADSGFDVIGIDTDENRCKMINSGKNPIPEEKGLSELIKRHCRKKFIATSRYKDAKDCDVLIIAVPLYVTETFEADFSLLESAFRNIGKILKKGAMVILETTVPPTTTETLGKKWLEEESRLSLENGEFYLAYSPERIMTGYSISRLKEFPKVIGGVNNESSAKALEFYKKIIPNVHLVSSARVAEFIKIIEGCYRDVNIALANELFKIANELSIDFYEAREFASHQYCHIHLPSTGVGGHCIPIYPWFLIKEMEKREKFSYARLLLTSREINDEQITYLAEKIVLGCSKIDKPLNKVKICLKGITFREGVKELHNSRNLALAKLLTKMGLNVFVYDEMLSSAEISGIGLRYIEPNNADLIFDCFKLKISQRRSSALSTLKQKHAAE